MEISGIKLLSYQEVLEEIKDKENHLLLGNGFNRRSNALKIEYIIKC